MAKKGKDESIIRCLVIVSMLNEKKLVTFQEIIKRLNSHFDINADRKTIYSDIRAIDQYIPVEVVQGKKGGYRKIDFARYEDGKCR